MDKSPGEERSMLMEQVCAAHMAGFLVQNSLNNLDLSRQIFPRNGWLWPKFARNS